MQPKGRVLVLALQRSYRSLSCSCGDELVYPGRARLLCTHPGSDHTQQQEQRTARVAKPATTDSSGAAFTAADGDNLLQMQVQGSSRRRRAPVATSVAGSWTQRPGRLRDSPGLEGLGAEARGGAQGGATKLHWQGTEAKDGVQGADRYPEGHWKQWQAALHAQQAAGQQASGPEAGAGLGRSHRQLQAAHALSDEQLAQGTVSDGGNDAAAASTSSMHMARSRVDSSGSAEAASAAATAGDVQASGTEQESGKTVTHDKSAAWVAEAAASGTGDDLLGLQLHTPGQLGRHGGSGRRGAGRHGRGAVASGDAAADAPGEVGLRGSGGPVQRPQGGGDGVSRGAAWSSSSEPREAAAAQLRADSAHKVGVEGQAQTEQPVLASSKVSRSGPSSGSGASLAAAAPRSSETGDEGSAATSTSQIAEPSVPSRGTAAERRRSRPGRIGEAAAAGPGVVSEEQRALERQLVERLALSLDPLKEAAEGLLRLVRRKHKMTPETWEAVVTALSRNKGIAVRRHHRSSGAPRQGLFGWSKSGCSLDGGGGDGAVSCRVDAAGAPWGARQVLDLEELLGEHSAASSSNSVDAARAGSGRGAGGRTPTGGGAATGDGGPTGRAWAPPGTANGAAAVPWPVVESASHAALILLILPQPAYLAALAKDVSALTAAGSGVPGSPGGGDSAGGNPTRDGEQKQAPASGLLSSDQWGTSAVMGGSSSSSAGPALLQARASGLPSIEAGGHWSLGAAVASSSSSSSSSSSTGPALLQALADVATRDLETMPAAAVVRLARNLTEHRCGKVWHMDAIAHRLLSAAPSPSLLLHEVKPYLVFKYLAILLSACRQLGYRDPDFLDAIAASLQADLAEAHSAAGPAALLNSLSSIAADFTALGHRAPDLSLLISSRLHEALTQPQQRTSPAGAAHAAVSQSATADTASCRLTPSAGEEQARAQRVSGSAGAKSGAQSTAEGAKAQAQAQAQYPLPKALLLAHTLTSFGWPRTHLPALAAVLSLASRSAVRLDTEQLLAGCGLARAASIAARGGGSDVDLSSGQSLGANSMASLFAEGAAVQGARAPAPSAVRSITIAASPAAAAAADAAREFMVRVAGQLRHIAGNLTLQQLAAVAEACATVQHNDPLLMGALQRAAVRHLDQPGQSVLAAAGITAGVQLQAGPSTGSSTVRGAKAAVPEREEGLGHAQRGEGSGSGSGTGGVAAAAASEAGGQASQAGAVAVGAPCSAAVQGSTGDLPGSVLAAAASLTRFTESLLRLLKAFHQLGSPSQELLPSAAGALLQPVPYPGPRPASASPSMHPTSVQAIPSASASSPPVALAFPPSGDTPAAKILAASAPGDALLLHCLSPGQLALLAQCYTPAPRLPAGTGDGAASTAPTGANEAAAGAGARVHNLSSLPSPSEAEKKRAGGEAAPSGPTVQRTRSGPSYSSSGPSYSRVTSEGAESGTADASNDVPGQGWRQRLLIAAADRLMTLMGRSPVAALATQLVALSSRSPGSAAARVGPPAEPSAVMAERAQHSTTITASAVPLSAPPAPLSDQAAPHAYGAAPPPPLKLAPSALRSVPPTQVPDDAAVSCNVVPPWQRQLVTHGTLQPAPWGPHTRCSDGARLSPFHAAKVAAAMVAGGVLHAPLMEAVEATIVGAAAAGKLQNDHLQAVLKAAEKAQELSAGAAAGPDLQLSSALQQLSPAPHQVSGDSNSTASAQPAGKASQAGSPTAVASAEASTAAHTPLPVPLVPLSSLAPRVLTQGSRLKLSAPVLIQTIKACSRYERSLPASLAASVTEDPSFAQGGLATSLLPRSQEGHEQGVAASRDALDTAQSDPELVAAGITSPDRASDSVSSQRRQPTLFQQQLAVHEGGPLAWRLAATRQARELLATGARAAARSQQGGVAPGQVAQLLKAVAEATATTPRTHPEGHSGDGKGWGAVNASAAYGASGPGPLIQPPGPLLEGDGSELKAEQKRLANLAAALLTRPEHLRQLSAEEWEAAITSLAALGHRTPSTFNAFITEEPGANLPDSSWSPDRILALMDAYAAAGCTPSGIMGRITRCLEPHVRTPGGMTPAQFLHASSTLVHIASTLNPEPGPDASDASNASNASADNRPRGSATSSDITDTGVGYVAAGNGVTPSAPCATRTPTAPSTPSAHSVLSAHSASSASSVPKAPPPWLQKWHASLGRHIAASVSHFSTRQLLQLARDAVLAGGYSYQAISCAAHRVVWEAGPGKPSNPIHPSIADIHTLLVGLAHSQSTRQREPTSAVLAPAKPQRQRAAMLQLAGGLCRLLLPSIEGADRGADRLGTALSGPHRPGMTPGCLPSAAAAFPAAPADLAELFWAVSALVSPAQPVAAAPHKPDSCSQGRPLLGQRLSSSDGTPGGGAQGGEPSSAVAGQLSHGAEAAKEHTAPIAVVSEQGQRDAAASELSHDELSKDVQAGQQSFSEGYSNVPAQGGSASPASASAPPFQQQQQQQQQRQQQQKGEEGASYEDATSADSRSLLACHAVLEALSRQLSSPGALGLVPLQYKLRVAESLVSLISHQGSTGDRGYTDGEDPLDVSLFFVGSSHIGSASMLAEALLRDALGLDGGGLWAEQAAGAAAAVTSRGSAKGLNGGSHDSTEGPSSIAGDSGPTGASRPARASSNVDASSTGGTAGDSSAAGSRSTVRASNATGGNGSGSTGDASGAAAAQDRYKAAAAAAYFWAASQDPRQEHLQLDPQLVAWFVQQCVQRARGVQVQPASGARMQGKKGAGGAEAVGVVGAGANAAEAAHLVLATDALLRVHENILSISAEGAAAGAADGSARVGAMAAEQLSSLVEAAGILAAVSRRARHA